MTDNIKMVSVCMITYNHEKYIRQAIDSILMQLTDFEYELVIANDNSPDKTHAIISEYMSQHPKGNLINYIHNENNVGAMQNFLIAVNSCNGKYIALCEGDDYWIDPYKLQKQVDFLETNLDCSLCFHPSKYIVSNNPINDFVHRPKSVPKDNKFSIKHVIYGGGSFMATNSMVFLNDYLKERPFWLTKSPVGDSPLMLFLASKGKIGYLDEVMSVYRVLTPGSWSQTLKNKDNRYKHFRSTLKLYSEFNRWSKYRYFHYILIRKVKTIYNYYKKMI